MAWRTAGKIVALPVYICSTMPLSARALGSVSPRTTASQACSALARRECRTRVRAGGLPGRPGLSNPHASWLLSLLSLRECCCDLRPILCLQRHARKGRMSQWLVWLRTGRSRLIAGAGKPADCIHSRSTRVWSPSIMHSGCCSLLAPDAHGFPGLFFCFKPTACSCTSIHLAFLSGDSKAGVMIC